MKSTGYILITALFCAIIVSACQQSITTQKQILKIQSVENSNSDILSESCSIISNRLKDYNLQNFDVSVNADQKDIEISLDDKTDVNEILPLFTSKGKLEFYEPYNRSDFIKLLEKGDTLFSLLNIPSEDSGTIISSAVLGYCKPENILQVDSYLTKHYASKPIAIAIDNLVYFDPILKKEIDNGQCLISGNLTLKEVMQLKSLINNNELPVEFQLIK